MEGILKLRRFIIIPLLFLGTLAWAQGGLAPATNSGNMSIQFPASWGIQTVAGRGVVASAPKADNDSTGDFQATINITQSTGSKVNGAEQQAQLAKQVGNYKVIEAPTPVTVNGLTGVRFAGTFNQGSLQLFSRQYIFTANNQIYVITFASLTSRWPAYQPVLEASVATFAVKK